MGDKTQNALYFQLSLSLTRECSRMARKYVIGLIVTSFTLDVVIFVVQRYFALTAVAMQ